MINSTINAIKSCADVDGDIIFFRVYKGDNLIKINREVQINKHVHIVHNSLGMEEPCQYDFEKNNSTCLYTKHRFAYSKKDLKTKIESNCKKLKYTLYDFKTCNLAISKLNIQNISVAVLDLIQYNTTTQALKYVFDILSIDGMIILTNYSQDNNLSSKAFNDFINLYGEQVSFEINKIEKTVAIRKNKDILREQLYEPIQLSINHSNHHYGTKIKIACVLLNGGPVYNYNYVNALANAVNRNVTVPYEFVCLTDNPSGFNDNIHSVIKLKHNFNGWWSKIELFRNDIFKDDQVFFMDLDTVIIDNIDDLLKIRPNFCGTRDFLRSHDMNSSVMSWFANDNHHIYEKFMKNPTYVMNNTHEGDQRWIDNHTKNKKYFQDIFGNTIVSYKKHCLRNSAFRIPHKTKIICFHGVPKPHSITNKEISDHWIP